MAETERTTAVGVFIDRSHAEHAVDELQRSGFRPDQIGFVVPGGSEKIEPPPLEPGTKAEEGAAGGAVAGGVLGGLVGAALATAIIPGVGPVLAGGLLAAVLGGAAVGATGGGIFGALIGMEIPEEEARHYEREFHSGRTLVTVRADGRYDEAVAILRRAAEESEHRPPGSARGGLSRLEGGPDSGDGSGSAFVPRP